MQMTIGQHFPGDSFLHKLDPRTKLLWTVFYMILLFAVKTVVGFSLFLVYTIFVVLLTKIPFRFYLRGLKPLLFLMLFTGVFNVFLTPGAPLFTIPYLGWSASREGLVLALLTMFRLLLLVIGTSVLTYTTSPILLTDGLEHLMRPLARFRFPAHEIAMMMTIALRFIPTLTEETDKIIKAQTARGADFMHGNLMQRIKALIPLLVPLFISAFRRADELATAMECRCYHGGEGRTSLKQLLYTKKDLWFGLSFLLLLAGVILSQIYFPHF